MKVSKSAIFLFELMAVILIFTFAAAICTDIFAKAFQVSNDSRNLTKALIRVETVAEEFKADPDATESGTVFYNLDWDETEETNDAEFVLYKTVESEGELATCNLVMCKIEGKDKYTTITQIQPAVYVPGGLQGGGN